MRNIKEFQEFVLINFRVPNNSY